MTKINNNWPVYWCATIALFLVGLTGLSLLSNWPTDKMGYLPLIGFMVAHTAILLFVGQFLFVPTLYLEGELLHVKRFFYPTYSIPLKAIIAIESGSINPFGRMKFLTLPEGTFLRRYTILYREEGRDRNLTFQDTSNGMMLSRLRTIVKQENPFFRDEVQ